MFTNEGRIYALKVLTGTLGVEGIEMGLYTAISSPWAAGTVIGDLTEPTETGYARQACAGWGTPAIDGLGHGNVVGTPVVFSDSDVTPIVALGFFYISDTTGALLGGDDFAAPLTIPALVGSLSLTPNLVDDTL